MPTGDPPKCTLCGNYHCSGHYPPVVYYWPPHNYNVQPQIPTGWQCPLCKIIHSPNVLHCNCLTSPPPTEDKKDAPLMG